MIWLAVPVRQLTQSSIAETCSYVQTISDAFIGLVHRSMEQIFSNIRLSLFKENVQSEKAVYV